MGNKKNIGRDINFLDGFDVPKVGKQQKTKSNKNNNDNKKVGKIEDKPEKKGRWT